MPLVAVDGAVKRSEGRQPVIVFSEGDRSLGLMVDEIVDIVDERLNIGIASSQPGLIGSAVIQGRATEVIDASYLLEKGRDLSRHADVGDCRGQKSILVIDDSPFFRNLVAPLLLAAGYGVTSVSSADQALRLKNLGHRFDLIVSDVDLLGADGLEFARVLSADPEWGATPLIALSSLCEGTAVERGLEAGYADYVSKADRSNLVAIISNRLENSGVAA